MRLPDINHRWVLNKRSLGYGNGSCTLGKQAVAAEPKGLSMDKTKQQTSPWILLDYVSSRAENNDNWAILFLEDVNTGTCPSRFGESQI
jgi:hypothetical protein